MESNREIDLSVRWREPRKAIVGTIDSPHGQIVVMAIHLELLPCERRSQFGRLKARISEIAQRPLIVLGDFNYFPGWGLAERSLYPPLNGAPELPTYPSRLPLLPLDRIWFSKPLELSDHLPLLTTLRLPGISVRQ